MSTPRIELAFACKPARSFLRALRLDQRLEQILHGAAGGRAIGGRIREQLQKDRIVALDADELFGERQVQVRREDLALQLKFGGAKSLAGLARRVEGDPAGGAGF